MSVKPAKLWVVGGPTASGKTQLSIQMAQRLACPIISFDSRQFYKEMHIGTARPLPETWNSVPHYFLGHASIHDPWDAQRFAKEAKVLLELLSETHEHLVLVGGSGFYADALLYGLDELPASIPAFREACMADWHAGKSNELIQKLWKIDPVSAARIDLKNPVRVIRALEIFESSGTPMSALQGKREPLPYPVQWIVLTPERQVLWENIALRTRQMMESGLRDEALGLYPFKHLSALQTVGYSEWFDAWDGKFSEAGVEEKIILHTRQYAKRQDTWFRRYTAARGDEKTLWSWFQDQRVE